MKPPEDFNRRAANKAHHNRIILDHLLEHPCVDCGEGDPVVLDFDHIGNDKAANVSWLARTGATWDRIEAEIAKCEVRCANCHRRRTMASLKSYRWLKSLGT